MLDYISRQEALNAIERAAEMNVADVNHNYLMGFQEAAEVVRNVPSANIGKYEDALKKQEPVPPDYVSDGYDPEGLDVWEPYCPSCGHNLEDCGEPRYCSNCGQALKWEDDRK